MINHKMEVETKDRELVMTRVFDAPRELMFKVWSSCEHLSHWWGPKEWPMQECSMDFREGGVWFYCMHGPNNEKACGKAVYLQIRKPAQIVYRDSFTDEEGTVNKELPELLVTVKFLKQKDKTRQVMTVLFDTPEERKTIVEMGMVEGMNSSLDRLDEHFEHIMSTNNNRRESG